MRKIIIIILSFLFCSFFYKINASEYITYSDWQEEYPSWLDEIFIQSEDRYLWYKEEVDNETGETKREEVIEYYKELDGYIKKEESKKTFYRYITNKKVLFDESGNIVYDDSECVKLYCSLRKLPEKPIEKPPDVIENPKTYDNIFVFLIISFISFVSIVLLVNTRKIDLVMSNQFKKH